MMSEEKVEYLLQKIIPEINKFSTREAFLEAKHVFSSENNEVYQSLVGIDKIIFDGIIKRYMDYKWPT